MIRWLAAGAVLLGAGTETSQSQVRIREDGTLVVKGEPFFPLGFIHVSSAADAEKRSTDLQMMAVGGFNVMQAEVKAGDGPFLDIAEALGIRILGKAADADALKAAAKDLKGKGALLGWNIAEEADNGKSLPAEVVRLHKEIKALDPGRPTYLTCADIENCGRFFDGADLIGLKALSLPGNLSGPANLFSAALKAAGEKPRPFLAVIQAWAPKDKPAPTPDEVRNMTYQALLQGARGILYHAYLDKEWDLASQTDLWNGIRVVATEIQTLRPMLTAGRPKAIETRSEDILAGTWTHQGRLYLVVLTAYQDPKKVAIPLPPEVAGAGLPQFRIPAKRLTLDGNKLMGEMEGGGLHIYMFDCR
jgi:hypothetical protein